MKTIEEAREYAEKQLGEDSALHWKRSFHYGRCELHQLLQYIYGLEDNTRELMDKDYTTSMAMVTDIQFTRHSNNPTMFSVYAILDIDPKDPAFLERIASTEISPMDFDSYKKARIGKTYEEVKGM